MMEKKIIIIQHVDSEGPGIITDMFSGNGWVCHVVSPGRGEQLPGRLDDIAAIVSLGGPMSVYDETEYPFLLDEDRFIVRALVEEVPFLGICLGAQLLAKACGSVIRKAPKKEIGWQTVTINSEAEKDRLFQGLKGRLKVFQWHEDTFDVPDGGQLLARGRSTKNQAFRVGPSAYGLQFHLEATPEMISCWMSGEGVQIDAEKLRGDTQTFQNEYLESSRQFFQNFRSLVESSYRIRRVIKVFIDDEKNAKKKSFFWWIREGGKLCTGLSP